MALLPVSSNSVAPTAAVNKMEAEDSNLSEVDFASMSGNGGNSPSGVSNAGNGVDDGVAVEIGALLGVRWVGLS